MLDTNQLLSIAFSLISQFTNNVSIPINHAPQHQSDLLSFVIGSPASAIDVYLVHKLGDQFWIHDGVVCQYQSPLTYFHQQGYESIARLTGPGLLSSNQVVQSATQLMQHLSKDKSWSGPAPNVKHSQTKNVEFYFINWPIKASGFRNGLGAVEIDARSGTLAFIELRDRQFYDLAAAADISNRVYSADSTGRQPQANPAASMPKPRKDETEVLIREWLSFCKVFDLQPGSQTNVSDIDWIETVVFKDAQIVERGDLYKIQFRNGAEFEAVNGKVFSYCSSEAGYSGAWETKPPEYWKQFNGDASKQWGDLATNLNTVLSDRCRVSQFYLEKFTPKVFAMGRGGSARCLVRWCEIQSLKKHPSYSHALQTPLLAEFDLATGDTKSLRIQDSTILNALKTRAAPNK